jgi:hypothetical protein
MIGGVPDPTIALDYALLNESVITLQYPAPNDKIDWSGMIKELIG